MVRNCVTGLIPVSYRLRVKAPQRDLSRFPAIPPAVHVEVGGNSKGGRQPSLSRIGDCDSGGFENAIDPFNYIGDIECLRSTQ